MATLPRIKKKKIFYELLLTVFFVGTSCYFIIRACDMNKEEAMAKSLVVLDSVGKAHHKVIAITETGYEGIKDPKWWTETLLPAIGNYPISYVLVWRNARERVTHFYAPYPGQVSADDFMTFYKNPRTLFASDVDLYK